MSNTVQSQNNSTLYWQMVTHKIISPDCQPKHHQQVVVVLLLVFHLYQYSGRSDLLTIVMKKNVFSFVLNRCDWPKKSVLLTNK